MPAVPSPFTDTSPNRTRCPLCGQPNACGMEAARARGEGEDVAAMPPCWCTRRSFPQSLLAKLPAEAQGAACICEACVLKAVADEQRAP